MMDATKREREFLAAEGPRLGEAQVPPSFTSTNLKAAFILSSRIQAWLQAIESHLRFAKLAARKTD